MEDVGKQMQQVLRSRELSAEYEKLMEAVLADPEVHTFIQTNQELLSPEAIRKSYAKLYEFVQEKRKFAQGDPTMIAPGYEPKLFMNYHYIDVTYIPTEALIEQQKVEEIRNRIHALDMPKDIREARFSDFEMDVHRKSALAAALNFINAYLDAPQDFHKGLYLQGSFGVGKTYLLGAIAHELAKNGFTTTLVHFPTFAVEMKQAIGKDTVGEKLDAVKRAKILMLDDIGADSMSSWIRDDILGVVLQYRMQEQLPTFFSSNFDMQQLEEEHLRISQRGEDEPLKAKRIMERIRYLSKEVVMIGKNRRND